MLIAEPNVAIWIALQRSCEIRHHLAMTSGVKNMDEVRQCDGGPVESQSGQSRRGIGGYWILSALFAVAGVTVMRWDQMLGNPDNLQALPGDLKRIVTLSEIFAHGFGIALVGMAIWVFSSPHRKLIPRIVMCAIWPALGANLVKLLFARFRPIKYFDELSQSHFPGNIGDTFLGFMPAEQFNTGYVEQSFPSAHAATAWGLAIGMTWAFPKGRWLFFGIAILASIQRVTSFAHWSSDVLWGIAIAFLMAGALTHNWGLGWVLHRAEIWASKDSCDKEEQVQLAEAQVEVEQSPSRAA